MLRRLVVLLLAFGAHAALAAEPLDAAAFWDLYFRHQFVRLERGADVWRGERRVGAGAQGVPGALLGERRTETVTVAVSALRRHDYAADPRFALTRVLDMTPAAALEAIVAQRYPYRDAAPYGRSRMSELMRGLQPRLSSGEGLRGFEQLLRTLLVDAAAPRDPAIAALVWFLGERRSTSSAPVLVEALARSHYVRPQAEALHFTATDAAFTALWKIADKSRLDELLDLMRRATSTGRWRFGQLFERLLSQEQLLGPAVLGDAYADPQAWARRIEAAGARDARAWAVHDARSLFWEIRLLAAQRLDAADRATLELLAADEVESVAAVARERLGR